MTPGARPPHNLSGSTHDRCSCPGGFRSANVARTRCSKAACAHSGSHTFAVAAAAGDERSSAVSVSCSVATRYRYVCLCACRLGGRASHQGRAAAGGVSPSPRAHARPRPRRRAAAIPNSCISLAQHGRSCAVRDGNVIGKCAGPRTMGGHGAQAYSSPELALCPAAERARISKRKLTCGQHSSPRKWSPQQRILPVGRGN
jgi:hypothetical protein